MEGNNLQKIITENYEKIYRYCYWQMRDKYLAQDITQEVFLAFISKYNKGLVIREMNAYLFISARNKCIDAKKSKSVTWIELTDSKEDFASKQAFDSVLNKVMLDEALSQLSVEEQELLTLRFSQDLKMGEIAEIMGMSRFNVRYRMKVALMKLKKKLGE